MNLTWPIVKALLEREKMVHPGHESDTRLQANTFILQTLTEYTRCFDATANVLFGQVTSQPEKE